MQTVLNSFITLYIKHCKDLTFNPVDGLPELYPIDNLFDNKELSDRMQFHCNVASKDILIWMDAHTISLVEDDDLINPLKGYLVVEFLTANKIDIFGLIKNGYAHAI